MEEARERRGKERKKKKKELDGMDYETKKLK